MYGIVNKAMKGGIVENFGSDTWKDIEQMAGGRQAGKERYDEMVTYQLAFATSEVLCMPVHDVLEVFGEYWIIKTVSGKYGILLDPENKNFRDMLLHLPGLHSRIMLMFREMVPTQFRIREVTEHSAEVHFYTLKSGLTDFIEGMLKGLAKIYEVEIEIIKLQTRAEGNSHDIFSVNWEDTP